jgi:hypothetical protein
MKPTKMKRVESKQKDEGIEVYMYTEGNLYSRA